MALVGKARRDRRHGGRLPGQHQALGVTQAELRLIEVRRQADAAAEGTEEMEAVDAGERRELGERDVLGEIRREVVESHDNAAGVVPTRTGMRHSPAMAAGEVDQGGDQERLALESSLGMLQGAMEPRKAAGERRIGDDGLWKERHGGPSLRRLIERSGEDGAIDIEHAVGVAAVARGRAAVMGLIRIDDDDAAGNRRPYLAPRREGMGPRLDDTEGVSLVGMPRIAMGTGICPQEVDAAELAKPPIARKHR